MRAILRFRSPREAAQSVEATRVFIAATEVLFSLLLFPLRLAAQQTPPPPTPIAYVATDGVAVSGSLEVANGKAVIGNNGAITASDRTASVSLARGGTLRLCATTTVHLSSDRSVTDVQSSALMIALDRGALEANYPTGKYSDVLMTPDLRILISGPGQADFKIRVSAKGDTCLDNHGASAPYVTVSSLIEGGLYRVQPNQRVLFEGGSLREVVDNEVESCGCPPAVADGATANGKPLGGPSSTPADTAFPLARSEGLAPPPPPPSSPAVPPGQAHAQVTVPLIFNGEQNGNGESNSPAPATEKSSIPAPLAGAAAGPSLPPAKKPSGFFHSIGHFFSRVFGGKT